ncbi:DUF5615 family PIN-like protein [Leptolyngbya sp. KIOST-1]|uniref:DUF5615 family PIN-like protein n=1 Tax=Leptolyngbya sp. KIOST-1 TaxID=1229172 RepID=UPI001CED91CB|nr:DUF5615 family PIN-like protein [Leptolyngbya sp. KIOST-1]
MKFIRLGVLASRSGICAAQKILIFLTKSAVVLTKDSDFIDLVCRLGTSPQILWLTCGNVTNRNLRQLLMITLPDALEQLRQGAMIVEISSSI